MEWLYIACIGVAGIVMLVMTIIIPYGVFMRYVVSSPSSWPEPAGILLMVVFSFIGGAAAYRARAHIAVATLLNALGDKNRKRTEFVAEIGMAIQNVMIRPSNGRHRSSASPRTPPRKAASERTTSMMIPIMNPTCDGLISPERIIRTGAQTTSPFPMIVMQASAP